MFRSLLKKVNPMKVGDTKLPVYGREPMTAGSLVTDSLISAVGAILLPGCCSVDPDNLNAVTERHIWQVVHLPPVYLR